VNHINFNQFLLSYSIDRKHHRSHVTNTVDYGLSAEDSGSKPKPAARCATIPKLVFGTVVDIQRIRRKLAHGVGAMRPHDFVEARFSSDFGVDFIHWIFGWPHILLGLCELLGYEHHDAAIASCISWCSV
jgi:hypothetical protein